MTNEEAISELNALNAICGQKDFYDSRFEEAFIMAVQALEKQTPAKVVYEEFPSGYRHYQCPVCGMTAIYDWCFWCGQALDLTEMHEWRKPIIEEIAASCDWSRTCYSFIQPKGDIDDQMR